MSKYSKSIYVILVNYKQPQLTEKCIHSIRQSNNVHPFIIVVDNCSKDQSVEYLNPMMDDHSILLTTEENRGFAAGNNIGIKFALENNADYIMLLNNDTEIDPDMISKLLQYTDSATVTAPKMYYFDQPDVIWFAGGKYLNRSGRFVHIGENQKNSPEYSEILECDYLTGCCIMLSSETIKKVGCLDENYFMYLEDVDYSLKLKSNGIRLLMIPEAKLWHKVGSSSGGERSKTAIYYGNRNRLFLQKKYHFSLYIRIITFLSRLLLLAKGILFNTNEKYISYSLIDFFSNRIGKRDLD